MVAAEARLAREAKAMTRREVIVKALAGVITWAVAASVIGVSERHMRRMKERYEQFGVDGLQDLRAGRLRARRVTAATIEEVCRLKRDVYPDFSMKHFHEMVTEKHELKLSYTLTRSVLQDAGLVEKAPGRGKYRRKRERRPMVGLMVHLDASTHTWLEGQPMRDLMVALDDADGRILDARFVAQESTASTFESLYAVLTRYGRFAELYTDRGSHFCRTPKANGPALTDGQVSRALKTLGIRQILARSPEARGRSERAFKTIQGRLPQELRVEGIRDYDAANEYLERVFVPEFNKRFTVTPAQPESAFIKLAGLELDLVLAEQHTRVVEKDNTLSFETLRLQLPSTSQRPHFVRCEVTVHRRAGRDLPRAGARTVRRRRTSPGHHQQAAPSVEGRVETRQPTGHHKMLMTRT
jgi:transposase